MQPPLQVASDGRPPVSVKGAGKPFAAQALCLLPSVREHHYVIVTFQLPPLQHTYGRKAEEYLSHLVGHEGEGSLLAALKARNWATELCAGARIVVLQNRSV